MPVHTLVPSTHEALAIQVQPMWQKAMEACCAGDPRYPWSLASLQVSGMGARTFPKL